MQRIDLRGQEETDQLKAFTVTKWETMAVEMERSRQMRDRVSKWNNKAGVK